MRRWSAFFHGYRATTTTEDLCMEAAPGMRFQLALWQLDYFTIKSLCVLKRRAAEIVLILMSSTTSAKVSRVQHAETSSRRYRLAFFLNYLWLLALLSAAVIFLSVGIERSDRHFTYYDEWLPVVLMSTGTACLAAFAYIHFGARCIPRMRVGTSIFTCAYDRWPSSILELQEVLADDKFKKAEIVGGGWSNTLQLRRSVGLRIHLGELKGQIGSAGSLEWLAGTELMHVQAELSTNNSVVLDAPFYGCVTLGAWVVTLGHGMRLRSTANAWLRAGCVVKALRRSNPRQSPEELNLYDELNVAKLIDPNSDYVVVSVRFLNQSKQGSVLVTDVEVTRTLTIFKPETDKFDSLFMSILEPNAEGTPPPDRLGVVFMGQDDCLNIRYEPRQLVQRLPSSAGWLTELSVAYFAYAGVWIGGLKANTSVRSRTTLQKAVAYFHWRLTAPLLFLNAVYPLMNFEVYFYPPAGFRTKQEKYRKFCRGTVDFHKKHGGRTEMRAFGSALALDVFVSSHVKCVNYIKAVLRTELIEASLVSRSSPNFSCHPGKLAIDKLWVLNSVLVNFVPLHDFLYDPWLVQ